MHVTSLPTSYGQTDATAKTQSISAGSPFTLNYKSASARPLGKWTVDAVLSLNPYTKTPPQVASDLKPHQGDRKLIIYTNNYSIYTYPYPGSFSATGDHTDRVDNDELYAKLEAADQVTYAFFQAYPNGDLHFSDVWGELKYTSLNDQQMCSKSNDLCLSMDKTGKSVAFNKYNAALGNFDAFMNLKVDGKKYIAIGGANTNDNKSASEATFKAILDNQSNFIKSLAPLVDRGIDGIDFDIEPDVNGNINTEDYKKLLTLIKSLKSTYKNLGVDVTLTPNIRLLTEINNAEPNGYFKALGNVINMLNIMTYDYHGAWNIDDDPLTSIHSEIVQPESSMKFSIDYGTYDTMSTMLAFGFPSSKLNIGIASYGRSYAGVKAEERNGFLQPWVGPGPDYGQGPSIAFYKTIINTLLNNGFKQYNDNEKLLPDDINIDNGAYAYNTGAQVFIGFDGVGSVASKKYLVNHYNLSGAILWDAIGDTDIQSSSSLIASYRRST